MLILVSASSKLIGGVIVKYIVLRPLDDAEINMGASQGAREEDTRIDIGVASSELKTNSIKPRRYNGTPYEPNITVSIRKGKKRVTLKEDRDYELKYQNNVNFLPHQDCHYLYM